MKLKDCLSKINVFCFFASMALSAAAQAQSDLQLDIGISINASRKYVEFWLDNWGDKPIRCDYIRQKVEYVDAVSNEYFGFRYVSIRNITIQPNSSFSEPQGGKEIIADWEANNRFAEIRGPLSNTPGDFSSKCAIVEAPPVVAPPPPPPPPAPVCTTTQVPKVKRSSVCGAEANHSIDTVFTPWQTATEKNVLAMCPWPESVLSSKKFDVVSGSSRHVTATCTLYRSCAHSSHGTTPQTVCQ